MRAVLIYILMMMFTAYVFPPSRASAGGYYAKCTSGLGKYLDSNDTARLCKKYEEASKIEAGGERSQRCAQISEEVLKATKYGWDLHSQILDHEYSHWAVQNARAMSACVNQRY